MHKYRVQIMPRSCLGRAHARVGLWNRIVCISHRLVLLLRWRLIRLNLVSSRVERRPNFPSFWRSGSFELNCIGTSTFHARSQKHCSRTYVRNSIIKSLILWWIRYPGDNACGKHYNIIKIGIRHRQMTVQIVLWLYTPSVFQGHCHLGRGAVQMSDSTRRDVTCKTRSSWMSAYTSSTSSIQFRTKMQEKSSTSLHRSWAMIDWSIASKGNNNSEIWVQST